MPKYTITSPDGKQKAVIEIKDESVGTLTKEQLSDAAPVIFEALNGLAPGTVALPKGEVRWILSKAEYLRVIAKHTGNTDTVERILTSWGMALAGADRPQKVG